LVGKKTKKKKKQQRKKKLGVGETTKSRGENGKKNTSSE